jgi:hypothetical protein
MENISIESINNCEIKISVGQIEETKEYLIIITCYDAESNSGTEIILNRESTIKVMMQMQNIINKL